MILAVLLLLTAVDSNGVEYKQLDSLPDKQLHILTDKYKDPESVRLRKLGLVNGGQYCGEVNAKNSFGAYTGYSKFMIDGEKVHVVGDKSDTANLNKFTSQLICNYLW